MPVTIKNITDSVDLLKPNNFTDAQKIGWINRLEKDVKSKIIRNFVKHEIQRVIDVSEYDLPDGVTFEDIEVVYLDGIKASRLDERSYLENDGDIGYYKTTNGKIGINPTPTMTDEATNCGIRLVYLSPFTEYTATSDTLLISDSFKEVYEFYLMAEMYFFTQDYDNYNNLTLRFNDAWDKFAKWYNSKNPVNRASKFKNIW